MDNKTYKVNKKSFFFYRGRLCENSTTTTGSLARAPNNSRQILQECPKTLGVSPVPTNVTAITTSVNDETTDDVYRIEHIILQ